MPLSQRLGIIGLGLVGGSLALALRRARPALRILGEEAEVQEEAVRAARESVLLTTNQYKAGIVSYINVVTVQTTQLSNERTAMGILGRRLVAAVTLVKAVGGGWSAAEIAADNR